MTYRILKIIVTGHALKLEEMAGQGGREDDGGCGKLLKKLSDFKNKIIYEKDLRPSEFFKIDLFEVGEPVEFEKVIQEHKLFLAKEIVKNIKL